MTRGRRIAGWILALLGIAIGAGAAFDAFLIAARFTACVPILVTAAALALAAVAFPLGRAAALQIAPHAWHGLALRLAMCIAAVVTVIGVVALFRPLDLPYTPAQATADTRYWDLSTGSRIAYVLAPASGTRRQQTPVIYLHGGAGVPAEAGERVLAGLAQDGFDVYYYDQFGCGLSSRSTDPRQYTIARYVADLEAIRQQLGADKLILVNNSWGSVLAAQYMIAYPQHVARVAFVSPAPMQWMSSLDYTDPSILAQAPLSKTRLASSFTSAPRYDMWSLLYAVNPQAARNFAGEREMDGVFERAIHAYPSGSCDPSRLDPVRGVGYYAYLQSTADWKRMADPRPALAGNHTPALILRGSCDFVRWDIAYSYKQILPDAVFLYIQDAGHSIPVDQPDLYLSAIRAFLLDQPLPLVPHADAQPPVAARP